MLFFKLAITIYLTLSKFANKETTAIIWLNLEGIFSWSFDR